MIGTASAEISIECPEGEAEPNLSMIYAHDTLSVTNENSAVSLPATIQGETTGMFTVYGSGTMDAMMPEATALDECLAAELREHGATAADVDMLAYSSNTCRLKLMPSGSLQKVQSQFTLTSTDKGKAMLFVQRQYLKPSAVTGKPLQLDEFPPRNCIVLSGD